jgi:hypothetical protein
MHRFGFVFICTFATTAGLQAASPNPADLEAPPEVQVKSRALVAQLGSEEYLEREDAQKQLAALGRLARPALLRGVNTSSNPEVRLRCAELLPAANALDLKARIETFLADTNGDYEHDLPAWKVFRATACREWTFLGQVVCSNRSLEKAAREIFVELIANKDNRRVMMAIEGPRSELADLVSFRRQELYNQRYPRGETTSRDPTLEDITALLIAESQVGSQYFPRRGSVSFLLSASGFTNAARGTDEKGQVYRAIAIAWLNSRNDPREMYMAMSVASSLELNDQICDLAVRLITMPGLTASYRSRAASNLVSFGNKRHIRLLEKATANMGVVYTVQSTIVSEGNVERVAYEIQLRDLALVISILLSEQKPKDYGLYDSYGAANSDSQSFSYTRYYFRTEEDRKNAFAKWAEWRKAHADD